MNFFKNIVTYLKKILKSNEEISTPKDEISNYKRLYNNIEVGNIIWAKRYNNKQDFWEFPKGHEKGPYLVIKKENNKLYCFYGTSVLPEHNQYIFIDNFEYVTLSKSTYFKFSKLEVIDETSFMSVLDKLKYKSLNELYRKIKRSKKTYYDSNQEIIDIKLPRQVGDIILYDTKKYVVVDINGNNLICVSGRYINKSASNLSFSNTITLNDSKDVTYIGSLSNNQLNVFLKNYREYINNLKNLNNTQRGSIILKNNKYYYIYGTNGEDLLAFEICEQFKDGYDELVINNMIFYTIYKELVINKKDKYENIYLCLQKEIDNIKVQRKKYKNKYSKHNISTKNNEIEIIGVSSIVKLDELSEEEFYVKQIVNNILVCESMSEKRQSDRKKYYFDKDDVILVKSKKRN